MVGGSRYICVNFDVVAISWLVAADIYIYVLISMLLPCHGTWLVAADISVNFDVVAMSWLVAADISVLISMSLPSHGWWQQIYLESF